MHGADEFLKAITMVLCVAAVTSVVFQRLRQPVVLGYILAGLIVGPHVPIPLAADREIIQTLSELGVILLMFSLGLEFSLRRLVQVGPTAALTAVVQCSLMIWLGFVAGTSLGWTARESLFAGAIIAISSTTIIAKAFDEQNIKGKLRELVVGVLLVEDLIAILLMTMLTALSSGDGLSAGGLVRSSGRLLAFLVALVVVGMLVVPRAIRSINRLKRAETTLVASVGICFGTAVLAHTAGYSVALGAFISGSLIAESGEEKIVEVLVVPVRDLFAAIFFVSVGMLIDPSVIVQHWRAVVVLTLLVVVGKVIGVSLGAFLSGHGTRTSIAAGMSLAQIGEFSFIIASLGITLRATGAFLYPVAVAVSALTTLTTPWLIRLAEPVAELVDRKLPKPLQTFAALYGSWLEQMRRARQGSSSSAVPRLVKLLLFDVVVLTVMIIGVAASMSSLVAWLSVKAGIDRDLARLGVIVGTVTIAVPFIVGALSIAGALGRSLALAALPEAPQGNVDLAAAPRRVLVVTLQLAVVLLVGLPLMAVTQPFLPSWVVGPSIVLLLIALSWVFWRSATNLQGHVRAGAEMIVEALMAQARKPADSDHGDLAQIEHLLPGIGDPVPLRLREDSAAVGRTLAQLNLRGRTGASVLAVARSPDGFVVPSAHEVLRVDDVLALAGTQEAVAAAKTALHGA